MISERPLSSPVWLCWLDLACVTCAGALWYAFPQVGPWPLALTLIPWGVRYALTRRLIRHSAFDLPLLVFVLTAGVSVWAAYDREAALPKFWLVVGGVLLFYALASAEPIGDLRGWLLAFFGASVALYFLATHDWDASPAKVDALTQIGRTLQAPLPELPGHRLNSNVAGGIMAMMLPFAGRGTIQAWQEAWHARRPLVPARWLVLAAALGILVLTSFGLLMTTSRGAWLGLAGALFLAGLWLISGLLSRGSAERRSWLFPALLVLVLFVALGIGVAWPRTIAAVVDLFPGPDPGLARGRLLRDTLTLAGDYPLIGAGLDNFQMLHATYVLLTHVGFTVHSHSLYLNVAVEQGLVALLALVWMWILFAVATWRGLLRTVSRAGRGVLGAAALSLVVVLLHGLVDDVLYGSRAVLLLFVPLAFAVPFLRDEERAARRPPTMLLPLAIVLFMVLALVWSGQVLSLLSSNLGAVSQSQAELSVYSWPEWPIQDEVRRTIDLSKPVARFERALELDPQNPTANRRLGQIELSLGEYEDALTHLEAAYAAEPGSNATRQLYGEALIVNGRLEEGQALWADVNTEQRQLALRVFWYDHIGDDERAAWVEQAAKAAGQ